MSTTIPRTCITITNPTLSSTTAIDTALQSLQSAIQNAKRILIVAGAGISVSANIPDFRSSGGLFDQVLSTLPPHLLSDIVCPEDIFSKQSFDNPDLRPWFYKFFSEFKSSLNTISPTKFHYFTKRLNENNQLLRMYTQNIDLLEQKTGLEGDMALVSNMKQQLKIVTCHGSVGEVICTKCKKVKDWNDDINRRFMLFGKNSLALQEIKEKSRVSTSTSSGRITRSSTRNVTIKQEEQKPSNADPDIDLSQDPITYITCEFCQKGIWRPNVVLYGETHPQAPKIAQLMQKDTDACPDIVIVAGTSLAITNITAFIESLARKVRDRDGGIVVCVNKTPLEAQVGKHRACWWRENVFDYEVVSDADAFAELMSSNK